MFIRMKLTADDFSPSNLRYDSGCDCVQQTPDGGTTWVNSPSQDPRTSVLFQLPPRGGSDPHCDAAANMVDKLKSQVNFFEQSLSILQAVNGFLAILTIFDPEIGIVLDVIAAVAEELLTIGADAIEGAFNDAQWALILCILYCGINSDGTVTADQLTAILAQIDAQCDPVVYDVMFYLLPMLGNVGLTNAGASGDVVGDCSSCVCEWCYTIDFTVSDGGFTPSAWGGSNAAAYTAGVGWHDNGGFGSVKGVFIQYAATEVIDYVSADIFWTDASNMQTVNVQGFTDPSGAPTYNNFVDIFGATSGDHNLTAEPTQYIQLSLDNSASGTGSVVLNKVILRGTGDNPFGTSNC